MIICDLWSRDRGRMPLDSIFRLGSPSPNRENSRVLQNVYLYSIFFFISFRFSRRPALHCMRGPAILDISSTNEVRRNDALDASREIGTLPCPHAKEPQSFLAERPFSAIEMA